ncbi:MAG TPA: ATP synthase subunit I [Rhodopila sp.]|uniref:N-ATPase subunit AtpR n=1 Tax=Rhodopila sp. TaxID=2480087 RepID=UPI002C1917F1|nr:ATP synthase subunit I [Rhodopila sp.]HVY14111.1 ATP synthase subunit I [Rhodopila sp.]
MMSNVGFLLVGLVAGGIYFAALRWNTTLYFARVSGPAIGLHLARLAGLGALLMATALLGAMPLLLCALGVFLARPVMMRLLP